MSNRTVRSIFLAVAAFTCGVTLQVARADDVAAGKAQFLTSCGVCHAVEPGAAARQGPNLAGVYGRAAGTLPDFKYSVAIKDGGWVWDEATLEPWMENAQAAHPGTIMNYRQKDPDKRKAILDFLKTLTKAP